MAESLVSLPDLNPLRWKLNTNPEGRQTGDRVVGEEGVRVVGGQQERKRNEKIEIENKKDRNKTCRFKQETKKKKIKVWVYGIKIKTSDERGKGRALPRVCRYNISLCIWEVCLNTHEAGPGEGEREKESGGEKEEGGGKRPKTARKDKDRKRKGP